MGDTVSVVIPTYNYGRFIAEAITSVLAQTRPASEIIVVDDGSTDDTKEIVGGFGPEIKYLSQGNVGVSAARNRGLTESTGDLIAFLDADDTWEATKLEKQVAKFSEDPAIGMVHCGMREFDAETGEIIRLHLEGGEEGVAENLLLWEGPVIVGPGGTVVFSRRALDEVGGFDTRMKCGEDWDLCYRVARKFRVGFVPEPLVNYRSHAVAAHLNVREMERGMSLFYEKAFSDPTVSHLRRRAYGNFHKVMAGSYYHSGGHGRFLSHSIRSVWMRPANLAHFLGFPARFLRRTAADVTANSDKNG